METQGDHWGCLKSEKLQAFSEALLRQRRSRSRSWEGTREGILRLGQPGQVLTLRACLGRCDTFRSFTVPSLQALEGKWYLITRAVARGERRNEGLLKLSGDDFEATRRLQNLDAKANGRGSSQFV